MDPIIVFEGDGQTGLGGKVNQDLHGQVGAILGGPAQSRGRLPDDFAIRSVVIEGPTSRVPVVPGGHDPPPKKGPDCLVPIFDSHGDRPIFLALRLWAAQCLPFASLYNLARSL